MPQQTDIGSGQRRQIEVIRLLQKIENRGRQNHGNRGIVAKDQYISLQQLCRSGVGTLGVADFRKRIVPPVWDQQLRQRFMTGGQ